MAFYKYGSYLHHSDDSKFDKIYHPGSAPDHSGIFRCEGCGLEVVGEASRTLPPQNHHQHTTAQGAIRWKLLVW